MPGLDAFGAGAGGVPARVVSMSGVVDVPGAAVIDGGAAVFASGVDGEPGLLALALGAVEAPGVAASMLRAGGVPGLVARGAGPDGLTPSGPGAGATVCASVVDPTTMHVASTIALVFFIMRHLFVLAAMSRLAALLM